MLMCWLQRWNQ